MKLRILLVACVLLSLMACKTGSKTADNITRPFSGATESTEKQKMERESSAQKIEAAQAATPALPPFTGLKKIVAVSRFENKSSFASQGAAQLGNGMRDMLADALMKSGRFVVLERQNLEDVKGEQNLAASGNNMRSLSARSGKLTSAQYIVQGVITEFRSGSEANSSGVSIAGFTFGGGSGETHIGGIIRMIDTTTGEVIASERVEAVAQGKSSSFGVNFGGIGFKKSNKETDPLDKAVQQLIDRAVNAVCVSLRDKPYRGRVVQVSDRTIVVSASARNGAKEGDSFTVLSVGKELKDPYTGELLGREEHEVGKLRITKVRDKYSFAKPDSKFKVKPGDFIQGS